MRNPTLRRQNRKNRRPRFSFTRNVPFYFYSPWATVLVNPGETLQDFTLRARLQSDTLDLSGVGAYVDIRAVYVPMRLMWSSWPDFLMGKTAFDFPTYDDMGINLAGAQSLGGSAITAPAYGLAALRRFFDDWIGTGDDDPTYAAGQGGVPVPRPDKTFLSDYVQDEEDADATVDTTGDSFTVNELEDAYVAREQTRLETLVDGDYMRYLRMAGVDADTAGLDRSEPLYRWRRWVDPVQAFAGDGSVAERYDIRMELRSNARRYFPEHGVVMFCGTIMPKYYVNVSSAFEVFTAPENFLTASSLGGGEIEANPSIGETVRLQMLSYLKRGEDQHILADAKALTTNPADWEDTQWPDGEALRAVLLATAASYPRVEGMVAPRISTPLS